MELIGGSGEHLDIGVSHEELVCLNNSLNEVLNGIDAIEPTEFHSRIGVTHTEASGLLAQLQSILKSQKKD